jgi:hypothetical protein
MVDVKKQLDELLDLYAKELPESSKTAAAIKQGAPHTDISQIAEEEGLHYISKAIFSAEEVELESQETASGAEDISNMARARIQEFRKHLPDGCETAAAMDRNASWSEIAQSAERDGLHEISSFIFEAEQQGLED